MHLVLSRQSAGKIKSSLIGTVGLLIAGILMAASFLCLKQYLDLSEETNVIDTIELVALGDTDKIEGASRGTFVRTIEINEIPVYRYMYKKDNGTIAMGEIDATTPVKEIDTGQARIELVERCYTEKMTRLVLGACDDTETTIYLPKDSIVKDFGIDVTK